MVLYKVPGFAGVIQQGGSDAAWKYYIDPEEARGVVIVSCAARSGPGRVMLGPCQQQVYSLPMTEANMQHSCAQYLCTYGEDLLAWLRRGGTVVVNCQEGLHRSVEFSRQLAAIAQAAINTISAEPTNGSHDSGADEMSKLDEVFTVDHIIQSTRSECVVSSGPAHEAVFGQSHFAMLSVHPSRNGHSTKSIPVHVIFDSNVRFGVVKMSETAALSLSHLSGALLQVGGQVRLEPVHRPPPAAAVSVSLTRQLTPSNTLMMDVTLETEHRMVSMCLRHQVFNSSVVFQVTPWLTATVASTSGDDTCSANMITGDTVISYNTKHLPIHNSCDVDIPSTEEAVLAVVSAEFVGSAKEVAQLVAQVVRAPAIQGEDSEHPAPTVSGLYGGRVNRGVLITGQSGSGKTHLVTHLTRALELYLGPASVYALDLRRLNEMEK